MPSHSNSDSHAACTSGASTKVANSANAGSRYRYATRRGSPGDRVISERPGELLVVALQAAGEGLGGLAPGHQLLHGGGDLVVEVGGRVVQVRDEAVALAERLPGVEDLHPGRLGRLGVGRHRGQVARVDEDLGGVRVGQEVDVGGGDV